MGIKLIGEILDYAPADLTPAEVLVLVIIAEHANDATREGWPGLDLIARRARLKRDSVSKIFQRLAKRTPPLELRVPVGTGSDGRPLFAFEQHRTVYRIPEFVDRVGQEGQSPDHRPGSESREGGLPSGLSPPEGGPPSGLSPQEPGPPSGLSPQEGGRWSGRGRTVVRQRADGGLPLPVNEPSEEPSSPRRSRAAQAIADAGASTNDEIHTCLEKIIAEHAPRNINAYVSKMVTTGDLPAFVATTLAEHHASTARAAAADFHTHIATQPLCGCADGGTPGGHIPRPDDGWVACPHERRRRGWRAPRAAVAP